MGVEHPRCTACKKLMLPLEKYVQVMPHPQSFSLTVWVCSYPSGTYRYCATLLNIILFGLLSEKNTSFLLNTSLVGKVMKFDIKVAPVMNMHMKVWVIFNQQSLAKVKKTSNTCNPPPIPPKNAFRTYLFVA